MERPKVTIPLLQEMKNQGEKITMLTAYDYPTAILVDRAGIDLILVGDSLAMTVLGLKDTVTVTMEEMLHHTRAVCRAVERTMVIGDMPFMSYNISVEDAIRNAGRFIKEAGADAIKLEGGQVVAHTVRALVDAGIPVMGHIGLTPQTAAQMGGFKVQGRTSEAAERLIRDARALEGAGVFSLVLEAVPANLAKAISAELSVPTIGIGAGSDCDGQVLVFHDVVGLFERFVPKFVKQYANLKDGILQALEEYRDDVVSGRFPEEKHTYK
ncbi:MAG: 3-methyl-2-oxobutanoate hydroxymethyltransferase [Bacillota bacterium]